jgi:hypothetical protein
VLVAETEPGRAFLSEARQARDHAVKLLEEWTNASFEPLFNQLNGLQTNVRLGMECFVPSFA